MGKGKSSKQMMLEKLDMLMQKKKNSNYVSHHKIINTKWIIDLVKRWNKKLLEENIEQYFDKCFRYIIKSIIHE